MHVCNEHRYGYMNVPVKSHQGLEDERVNFIHLLLEALGKGCLLLLPPALPYLPLVLGPAPAGQGAGGSASPQLIS